MDRWVGKVALVTGASAGIGAAIAEVLAKNGLKVVGLARRVDKIEELRKKLGTVKGELVPLKGDVAKEEDILKAFQFIKEKYGKIHVLVNNAGIVRFATITDGSMQMFRDTFDVNVMGLTCCTQQAVKLMREKRVDDGHIIHINSLAGHSTTNSIGGTLNVYGASKHAVTALTETLRQELNLLKSKIRVTSISPGMTDTEIQTVALEASGQSMRPDLQRRIEELTPLQPQDLADAVLYVLSTAPRVQVHELIIRPVSF